MYSWSCRHPTFGLLPSAIEIEGSIVGCISVVECISLLPSGVSTVGEYGLTGDPPAFGGKESYDRHDVFDFGQLTVHPLRLVKSQSISFRLV
jgi:hypothetical protein